MLTALKSDTAKYNFAYDTLSTYYQKWNEAVKIADQASQFIGGNVKVQGKEVSSLQDMADAYDDAIATAQGLASSAKALAERDSAYLRSLLAGWDNGGTLGDMVSEAAGLLTVRLLHSLALLTKLRFWVMTLLLCRIWLMLIMMLLRTSRIRLML